MFNKILKNWEILNDKSKIGFFIISSDFISLSVFKIENNFINCIFFQTIKNTKGDGIEFNEKAFSSLLKTSLDQVGFIKQIGLVYRDFDFLYQGQILLEFLADRVIKPYDISKACLKKYDSIIKKLKNKGLAMSSSYINYYKVEGFIFDELEKGMVCKKLSISLNWFFKSSSSLKTLYKCIEDFGSNVISSTTFSNILLMSQQSRINLSFNKDKFFVIIDIGFDASYIYLYHGRYLLNIEKISGIKLSLNKMAQSINSLSKKNEISAKDIENIGIRNPIHPVFIEYKKFIEDYAVKVSFILVRLIDRSNISKNQINKGYIFSSSITAGSLIPLFRSHLPFELENIDLSNTQPLFNSDKVGKSHISESKILLGIYNFISFNQRKKKTFYFYKENLMQKLYCFLIDIFG